MKSSLAQMPKCARVHRFEGAIQSAMHNPKKSKFGMSDCDADETSIGKKQENTHSME